MKRIVFDKSKYQPSTKKGSEWQELGKELTKRFKTNCFWIPWKYPTHKIYEAMKVVVKEVDLAYFLGILKR